VLAQEAVAGIRARERVAIFCGGTGLYFQAFLCGLGQAPPADPALRAHLEAMPLETLLAELAQGDPAGFETLDRRNPRRVIRAVEILRLTGLPPSRLRAAWPQVATPNPRCFYLYRDPGDLRQRIESRVDRMFERGLVAETRALLDCGLRHNRTAMQALGYRQVAEHLEGKRSLEETTELVKIRTWQFARRQRTWFRRQMRAEWIHIAPGETAEATATRLRVALSVQ
jgi:tRNA dimethylallyltransferase